jgi:hypothetical protein
MAAVTNRHSLKISISPTGDAQFRAGTQYEERTIVDAFLMAAGAMMCGLPRLELGR